MEPQNFNISMPKEPLIEKPKDRGLKIFLIVLLVIILLLAGITTYFFNLSGQQKCQVYEKIGIEVKKCIEPAPFALKEGEWISSSVSYIPKTIYEKLPIDNGVVVEHLFVKMTENRYEALDRYQSDKSIDVIYNEYKKFVETMNLPIISENKTAEKIITSYGIVGRYAITVEINKIASLKKQNVSVFWDFVTEKK